MCLFNLHFAKNSLGIVRHSNLERDIVIVMYHIFLFHDFIDERFFLSKALFKFLHRNHIWRTRLYDITNYLSNWIIWFTTWYNLPQFYWMHFIDNVTYHKLRPIFEATLTVNLFMANQKFKTFSLSYKLQANTLIYSYTPKLYDFVDLFTACLKCDGISVSYLLQTGTSIL